MSTQTHEHEHVHAYEHRLPPSGQGTVVLDIGDGIGALVVHTPGPLNGTEIEIAHRGDTHAFVHTEVRERLLPGGSLYAGVFPAIAEGDYTLLGVAGFDSQAICIRSGQVTEVALNH